MAEKGYCFKCGKVVNIMWDEKDRRGDGMIRGYATCCGKELAIKYAKLPTLSLSQEHILSETKRNHE